MKRIIALAVMGMLLSFSFFVPSAFSITYIYDDFDSDTIDESKWFINDIGNVFSQENSFLKLNSPPIQQWAHLNTKTEFLGDFEAIAEWSNYSYEGTMGALESFGSLDLEITSRWEVSENHLAINRAVFFDSGHGTTFDNYFVYGIVNGVKQWSQIQTEHTEGKFRFERVGETLIAEYWDDGWVELHSVDNFGTHEVQIQLGGYTGDPVDSVFSGEFDKLIVTHATVPEPTTVLLLGTGLLGLAATRRRIRK